MANKKILFIGSKKLGFDCMRAMFRISKDTLIGVLTIDDLSDKRSKFNEFQSFCIKEQIPFFVAKNRLDSENIIENIAPDYCIVVGWYWLIDKRIISIVPEGILGIHNSLLPKYRGGAPLVWSIINGEKKVGFSMFSFTEGMDDGDIWFQYSLNIDENDYINDVLIRLEKLAVEKFEYHYLDILNGKLKPYPQDDQNVTYCAQRIPNDGLIDWKKSAIEVYNFIRAQSMPYPGAFTFLNQEKLTIWSARLNFSTYYGTPGQVARITDNGVIVICGDNRSIILEQINFKGKDLNSNEVIKTINIRFN